MTPPQTPPIPRRRGLRRLMASPAIRALVIRVGQTAQPIPWTIRHRLINSPPSRLIARKSSRQLAHVFGDSHAQAFRDVQRLGGLQHTWFDVVSVVGATALGLANPNSRTNALAVFREALARVLPSDPVLFMLGEVDCGYLIWERAQRRGTTPEHELASSLAAYTAFLEPVVRERGGNVWVVVVPPPTVFDYRVWGGLGTNRSSVQASLRERSILTRSYNQQLREWVKAHGCHLIDYEEDVTDPETQLVVEHVRHPDPLNHHLAPSAFVPILVAHLKRAGFQ